MPPRALMTLRLEADGLQHIKRPALQNKQVVVLRMAFRVRKVLGTLEKRARFSKDPKLSG